MGIYLPNMEMPTSCESCPCKTADAFGGLGCQTTGYIPLRKVNQGRPDNCPLIPVPPHGRLIDADTVETGVGILINEYFLRGEREDFKRELRELIPCAPTIIPAEEG